MFSKIHRDDKQIILLSICQLIRAAVQEPEAAQHRYEVLQADAVGQFQMDLKMIGTVFERDLQSGEPEKRAQQRGKGSQGDRIVTHSQGDTDDNGNRKFIMVQLNEPVKKDSEAEKAGYKTIDEIGRERIRRAAAKINNLRIGA